MECQLKILKKKKRERNQYYNKMKKNFNKKELCYVIDLLLNYFYKYINPQRKSNK